MQEYKKDLHKIYIELLDYYLDNHGDALKNVRIDDSKNLFDMINTLKNNIDDMPPDKSSRWFGFIQANLVFYGFETVDGMRNHTRGLFSNLYDKHSLAYKSVSVGNKNHKSENEWENEPNEMFWTKDGIECRILRMLGFGYGHLCGYVKIPEGHPWYGMPYDDIPVECHGGLTYSMKEKDGYWIGFDCAHLNDMKPFGMNYGSCCVYRNMDFVKSEVEKMVDQVNAASKNE